MTKGSSFNVPYRRRRKGKTNYRLRKRLIASKIPRLVTRKTGKHIVLQLIKPVVTGDEVITSTHARELRKKYGWLGNLNNLPAAYLAGLVCGYRALNKKIKYAILDVGLHLPSKGAFVFAVVKGFNDAGVEVPCQKNKIPDEKRILGQHIADYAEQVASEPESKSHVFSQYLSRGLSPQDITKNFSLVKKKILSEFNKTK
jgi:large subunit ribosomal protein L18